jgi:hypothetical protein
MALSKSQSLSSLSSIEQLVSTLGDQLDLTGEQIADVLWLTLELQKFEISSDEEISNLQDANSDIFPKTPNQTTDESQVTKPITPPTGFCLCKLWFGRDSRFKHWCS